MVLREPDSERPGWAFTPGSGRPCASRRTVTTRVALVSSCAHDPVCGWFGPTRLAFPDRPRLWRSPPFFARIQPSAQSQDLWRVTQQAFAPDVTISHEYRTVKPRKSFDEMRKCFGAMRFDDAGAGYGQSLWPPIYQGVIPMLQVETCIRAADRLRWRALMLHSAESEMSGAGARGEVRSVPYDLS